MIILRNISFAQNRFTKMKKLTAVAAFLLGFAAVAQEGPIISSAIIALDRNNDLVEAKKYIDEAASIIGTKPLTEIKSKDLSKFYYYQGLINYRIASSEDAEVKALDANALDKAAEGFANSLSYEEQVGSSRYTGQSAQQIIYVATDFARRAIAKAGENDYAGAYTDFMKTYSMKEEMDQVDTTMLYNAAIMAQNAEMLDKAIEHNQKLIELGYVGVVYTAKSAETGEEVTFSSKKQQTQMVNSGKFTDPKAQGDLRADIYNTTAALALKQGDTALNQQLVKEGRQKFPNNIALLRSELQMFFDAKDYESALTNINQAIEASEGEDKVIMYYNKGVILQNEMERFDEALAAYQEALNLDPNYSDAQYMSSIIYIDRANAIGEEMNALPLSATSKYDALKKQQTEVFESAVPFLEAAYKSSPDDKQVITALRQVYRALKRYEDAQALPQ